MSRPIQPRRTKSYARDIEAIGRLRTAILTDAKLPRPIVLQVIKHSDALTTALTKCKMLSEGSDLGRF